MLARSAYGSSAWKFLSIPPCGQTSLVSQRSFLILADSSEIARELGATRSYHFTSAVGQSNVGCSAWRNGHLQLEAVVARDAPFRFDRPIARFQTRSCPGEIASGNGRDTKAAIGG